MKVATKKQAKHRNNYCMFKLMNDLDGYRLHHNKTYALQVGLHNYVGGSSGEDHRQFQHLGPGISPYWWHGPHEAKTASQAMPELSYKHATDQVSGTNYNTNGIGCLSCFTIEVRLDA